MLNIYYTFCLGLNYLNLKCVRNEWLCMCVSQYKTLHCLGCTTSPGIVNKFLLMMKYKISQDQTVWFLLHNRNRIFLLYNVSESHIRSQDIGLYCFALIVFATLFLLLFCLWCMYVSKSVFIIMVFSSDI